MIQTRTSNSLIRVLKLNSVCVYLRHSGLKVAHRSIDLISQNLQKSTEFPIWLFRAEQSIDSSVSHSLVLKPHIPLTTLYCDPLKGFSLWTFVCVPQRGFRPRSPSLKHTEESRLLRKRHTSAVASSWKTRARVLLHIPEFCRCIKSIHWRRES